MSAIQDSGSKREFDTGAHRDSAEGKGRCDLLPLDIVHKVLQSDTLRLIYEFTESKNEKSLLAVIDSFAIEANMPKETVLLEVAKQYEYGANKYGENNWKKGIPLNVFLDSAIRHYLKWRRGDEDEFHNRAFIWNILGAIWTFRNKPELDAISK